MATLNRHAPVTTAPFRFVTVAEFAKMNRAGRAEYWDALFAYMDELQAVARPRHNDKSMPAALHANEHERDN